MKALNLIIALLIVAAGNVAAANSLTADLPVYTQTCSRAGATFSCGSVTLLAGYSSLSQSTMSSTLLGNGCVDKADGIFFCATDSQFAQSMGGPVVLWARNYELIGMSPATAPVYIVYIYVLN